MEDPAMWRVTAEEASLVRNSLDSDHPAIRFLDRFPTAEDLSVKTAAFVRITKAIKAENDLIRAAAENAELHNDLADVSQLRKKLAKAELDKRDLANKLADANEQTMRAIAKDSRAS